MALKIRCMQSKEKVATPIIGRGEEMRALRGLISTVANSQATVLISGESGTGKELIARALHDESDRAGSRFVPVNCAAIPRELVEAELFGHRKGAFTGAVSDRVGRFELAHGGTLFLDEIGDLPLDIQVKLLRVLQERAVDPVGAMKAVEVDVRVVAASHKDLEAEVKAGRFREDLFYRLNVLPVQSPPLRRRADDIPELAAFHAKRLAPKGRDAIHFSPDMLLALKSYNWPGNVRELENLLERIFILEDDDEILPRHLPDRIVRTVRGGSQAPAPEARSVGTDDFHSATADFQRKLISRALLEAGGNVQTASSALKISRHALRHQMAKLGL